MQQLAVEPRVILQLLLAISGVHSTILVLQTTVYVLLKLPKNTNELRVLSKIVTATNYRIDTFILNSNEAFQTIKDYQTGIYC